jgi:hypothetical protein
MGNTNSICRKQSWVSRLTHCSERFWMEHEDYKSAQAEILEFHLARPEKHLKMAVFWVVAPCSLLEVYQRFRGPCCLHHQGDHIHENQTVLQLLKKCIIHRPIHVRLYTGQRMTTRTVSSISPTVKMQSSGMLCNDDGGSKHLWNVGQFLPDYMTQHRRRQSSLYSSPWEPEILQSNYVVRFEVFTVVWVSMLVF